jgi:hypothetical protein
LPKSAVSSDSTTGAFQPLCMLATYSIAVSASFTTKGTETRSETPCRTIATAVMAVMSPHLNMSSKSTVPAAAFFSSMVASTKHLGVARVAASGRHANANAPLVGRDADVSSRGTAEALLVRLSVKAEQRNPDETTSSALYVRWLKQ